MSTVRYLTDVSLENYVKAVYHLGRDGTRVKTKELAAHLNVSLPSVTGMLRSLSDDGLVDYLPYKGVRLTEEGQRVAVRVIRHHRLVETFLVEVLGYSWDEVHDEAEVLEHAVSAKLAAAIERHLGYPTVDPHGDPIPPAEGAFEPVTGDVLLDVPAGASTTITRIHDQSPSFLRYLEELGLTPGARVEVLEHMPFDGPVRLRCANREATLSRAQLSRIEVVPVQVIGSGVGS